MELLFVTVIAAGIGLVLRFALPGHDAYGLLLLPFLDAGVTAAVWVSLLWAGFRFDGGWIWAISLVLGAAAAIVVGVALPRSRRRHDESRLEQLTGTRRTA